MRLDGHIGWKRVPISALHLYLWRRTDERNRITLDIGDAAKTLSVSYYTVRNHCFRLLDQELIRFVKRVNHGQAVYEVTCPEGAETERGDARAPETESRVVRWG